MKSRKVKVLAGVLALAVVAGAMAYFSKTMSIDNPFATKKYGGETVEKFTPEKEWEPGGQVTKEVMAKNTGDYDLYVRVKFDEKWERDGAVIAGTQLSSVTDKDKFFPVSADNKVLDGSSVYKNLAGVTDATWEKSTDGYFYFKNSLKPGKMTSVLMDYVTLCKDADMGTYQESAVKYALVDASKTPDQLTDLDYNLNVAPDVIPAGQVLYQKKVISLDEKNAGFAGAKYTLTITTELLQANKDAAANSGWTYTPSN